MILTLLISFHDSFHIKLTQKLHFLLSFSHIQIEVSTSFLHDLKNFFHHHHRKSLIFFLFAIIWSWNCRIKKLHNSFIFINFGFKASKAFIWPKHCARTSWSVISGFLKTQELTNSGFTFNLFHEILLSFFDDFELFWCLLESSTCRH